jgi:hypothetical protein
MTLAYTWALKSLKKADTADLAGVIVQTQWTCTGTDEDGDSGVFNGATPFNPQEVDPLGFTAYEDLTEEQILGWIQAVVVGSYKEHIDAQIMKQIQLIKTPVEEVPEGQFPWSPPAEETDGPSTTTPEAQEEEAA